MNVERFAGDSEIFKMFAQQTAQNEAAMKRQQAQAMQNAYQQRARDVSATDVTNPGLFL